jgi:hypothetical protein
MRTFEMRVVVIAIAAVMAATAAQQASAKAHPRVAAVGCSTLAESVGSGSVWHAYFYGEQKVGINRRIVFSDAPCFRTQADCQNWLYWAQTDWPYEQNVRWCRRGLGPRY